MLKVSLLYRSYAFLFQRLVQTEVNHHKSQCRVLPLMKERALHVTTQISSVLLSCRLDNYPTGVTMTVGASHTLRNEATYRASSAERTRTWVLFSLVMGTLLLLIPQEYAMDRMDAWNISSYVFLLYKCSRASLLCHASKDVSCLMRGETTYTLRNPLCLCIPNTFWHTCSSCLQCWR